MAYAEKTDVSVIKTRLDIEQIVRLHGADQFILGTRDDMAVVGFTMDGRQIRITLSLPDKQDYLLTPARRIRRSPEQVDAAWEQACRARWRALYLIIKAKLEAIESGISTVEHEFLSDVVVPNGQTVGAFMAPQLEAAFTTGRMPALLPG